MLPHTIMWSRPSRCGFDCAQIAASSAVFAAHHLSGPEFLPLCVLGGVLGATLWAADGNVFAPMCAHALYNLTVLASIMADVYL